MANDVARGLPNGNRRDDRAGNARIDSWRKRHAALVAAAMKRPDEALGAEPPPWAFPCDADLGRAVWAGVRGLIEKAGGAGTVEDLCREVAMRGLELPPGEAMLIERCLASAHSPPVELALEALTDEARYERARVEAGLLFGALERREPWLEVVRRLEELREEVGRAFVGEDPENLGAWMEQLIAAETAKGSRVARPQIPVGPEEDLLPPLEPGSLVVVGADTSVGKSLFALNAMVGLGTKGIGSGYVSLEDPKALIAKRLFRIARSTPTAADARDAAYWVRELAMNGIVHLDEVTDAAVCASMVRLAERGARVVFVDYLQQVERAEREREDRRHQIRRAVTKIKGTAARLGISVVVTSQIAREGERRRRTAEDWLHSFKESGDVENKAEVCMVLVRHGEPDQREFDAWVVKNKINGRLPRAPMRVNHETLAIERRPPAAAAAGPEERATW